MYEDRSEIGEFDVHLDQELWPLTTIFGLLLDWRFFNLWLDLSLDLFGTSSK